LSKKNVLFVGSFKSKSTSGHVGGQMFACRSLVDSDLSKTINWIKIDTTASTNEARSFISRGSSAFFRLVQFTYLLLTRRVDTILVFCSSGWSFREKGVMVLIAKFFGKQAIIAPRSGFLLDNLEGSEKFKAFAKKVVNKADYTICQGTFWKEYFTKNLALPAQKAVVIHNWIADNSYTYKSRNNKTTTILFLGWIEQNKGIYEIMEAAKTLEGETIEWLIGGNGKEFEKVKQELEATGLDHKVKLKGWVLNKDKIELLENADIFVLPSYREGLPNALLEAMQYGLAVTASSVGAIPDVIDSGNNGILVPPKNAKALADAVKTLVDQPALRKEYGLKAMDKIKHHHSIEAAISKFNKILCHA